MAIDTTTPRSRRALLTAALGGAAAAAAAIVAKISPVEAADSEPLVIGRVNISHEPTTLIQSEVGMVLHAVTEENTHRSTGFFGESHAGSGIYGRTVSGVGVRALAATGTAVGAWSDEGTAIDAFSERGRGLRVSEGRVSFDQVSGVATIPGGDTSVTIRPVVAITGESFVLLTPMDDLADSGLWSTTDSDEGTITIRTSSPRSALTKVAWLLLG